MCYFSWKHFEIPIFGDSYKEFSLITVPGSQILVQETEKPWVSFNIPFLDFPRIIGDTNSIHC